MIQKNHSFFSGRDFLVQPYLLDDHMKRKDKQPKFVQNKNFLKSGNDLKEDLAFEHFFMTTCREGRLFEPKNPKGPLSMNYVTIFDCMSNVHVSSAENYGKNCLI